jgi:hypothetical protein
MLASNARLRKKIVPGVKESLTDVVYHRYATPDPDGEFTAMAERARSNGLGLSMLEWWDVNNSYHRLHRDLKEGNLRAWQQGSVAFYSSDKGPGWESNLFHIDDVTDPKTLTVTMGHQARYFRQYAKFVRRGATRIDATSDDASFDPVAFSNKGGGQVVVVRALAAGVLSIRGLPPATYGIKYTTGDGTTAPKAYNVDHPDAVIASGQALETSIPDPGVLTVHARSRTDIRTRSFSTVSCCRRRPSPFAVAAPRVFSRRATADGRLRAPRAPGSPPARPWTIEREPWLDRSPSCGQAVPP